MISINKSSRDQALDLMRGIAIIMMIVFHLIYDLNEFGYTNIPLSNFWLTSYWRYLIVFLFLNAVGISLVIAYGKSFNLNKFISESFVDGEYNIEHIYRKNPSKKNCRFCEFNQSKHCDVGVL